MILCLIFLLPFTVIGLFCYQQGNNYRNMWVEESESNARDESCISEYYKMMDRYFEFTSHTIFGGICLLVGVVYYGIIGVTHQPSMLQVVVHIILNVLIGTPVWSMIYRRYLSEESRMQMLARE